MWTGFYCLLFLAFSLADADSTDSSLDPKSIEDNHSVLQSQMQMADSIVSLSEIQMTLINSLLAMNERLWKVETNLLQFIEKSEATFSNLENSIRQLSPTFKSDAFRESTQNDLSTMENGDHNLEKNLEWTTIARRQDGSVDFNRTWTEYENGFGNPNGEFFIGLEKLHNLTTQGEIQELVIILEDFQNEKRFAKYDNFKIGSGEEKYKLLELGTYSGDAGDSLVTHKNKKFTTYDNDNDNDSSNNCAKVHEGGWWFDNCNFITHLFGLYGKEYAIFWFDWKGDRLKFVEMKIRAKL